MHATLSAPSLLSPAGHGSGPGSPQDLDGASPANPAQVVDSTELLKGHKTVAIKHNGSVYRLQATKLGKLILTK